MVCCRVFLIQVSKFRVLPQSHTKKPMKKVDIMVPTNARPQIPKSLWFKDKGNKSWV